MPSMDTPDTHKVDTPPPVVVLSQQEMEGIARDFFAMRREWREVVTVFGAFVGDDAPRDDEYGLCAYCKPQPFSGEPGWTSHRDGCEWVVARALVDGWMAK